MKILERGTKLQRKLFLIIFIGLLLTLERYYIGIIPFIDKWFLPISFVILVICLFFLYIIIFISMLIQLFKKFVLNKRFFEKTTINKYFGKYALGLLGTIVGTFFLFWLFILNPYYKVEIVNKSNLDIEGAYISTSFSNELPAPNFGLIKSGNSETLRFKNIEEFPNTFYRKISLTYYMDDVPYEINKKTSFLRTKFIIDGKHYYKSDLNCEHSFDIKEINGKNIWIEKFNFCDKLLKNYTINIVDAIQDGATTHLLINTPKKYRIKKAQRILYWYPSIWSKMEDDLIQYIRFDDFLFQTTENLRVLSPSEAQKETLEGRTYNNVIQYSNIDYNNYDLSFFKNIDEKRFRKSLESHLLNYANKEDEINKWLQYSKKYSKGAFLDKSNEFFSLDCYDVYIKITFDSETGDFIRVLHDEIQIGN